MCLSNGMSGCASCPAVVRGQPAASQVTCYNRVIVRSVNSNRFTLPARCPLLPPVSDRITASHKVTHRAIDATANKRNQDVQNDKSRPRRRPLPVVALQVSPPEYLAAQQREMVEDVYTGRKANRTKDDNDPELP